MSLNDSVNQKERALEGHLLQFYSCRDLIGYESMCKQNCTANCEGDIISKPDLENYKQGKRVNNITFLDRLFK